MIRNEENVMLVNEFLEKGDCRVLLITLTQAGALQPAVTFPSSLKAKGVYFVKKLAEAVKKGSFKKLVLYGEMSSIPLDQLTSMFDNVVLPLVSNGRNHRLWPQVVSQDVLRHTGGLKGDVLTLSGQVKGKTLLPLPPQAESAAMAAADIEAGLGPSQKHVVHAVESVVIEWCHQVRDVLKRSSAQPLLDGLHPGPLAEVTFWKERCLDMESIVDQLSTPKVRKMCVLLERTISSYYPAFVAMLESVDAALREARDISMHLKPLQRQFEELEAGDFLALPLRFPALFHTVCLVWAHSTHYRQPARLVVLLQEACNLLIELRQWYWL